MENLVVLAGAGTSVSSGGKTMVNLEREVLATVKALQDIPASISAVVDERTALPEADEMKVGFEDWLSFLANASFIGALPGSPFSGVEWEGVANPTQAELSWLVNKTRAAIFAECSLLLLDTAISTSGVTDVAPHLAFLAKLVARDAISAARTSSRLTMILCLSRL
jgi:hypothetical protein